MFLFFLNILHLSDHYKKLLSANYPFIKRVCVKVVHWHGGSLDDAAADDAEYLLGRVLDQFMADDYRRLRTSEIRNVKTFFRSCIENLFKDILAERHGKDRGGERAREFGAVGVRVRELMKRGHTTDAIHAEVAYSFGGSLSWEDVYAMEQRIKGSNALPPTDGNKVVLSPPEEGGDPEPSDFEIVDDRWNPEWLTIEKRKELLRREVLKDLEELLDDEGKVMVRLYYLEQRERKCTVSDIANYLGKTPKAADHKLRRILDGFRNHLAGKGIGPDDIL
ncbi:transcriptional regulator [Geomonas paludis]|uniref:Transcriptional regulator n=1 Tax=Geomonas paludis TaxID=2740185 RepID=A0A6V8MTG4_9BACT|nr:ArsR family transcriptional regulator [Geomonas paludis]UPU38197.1 transcriptional regulator [Geomonas paludis]GFO63271.1 hypothetical protein GMPD_11900 [Geomonas paludis]